MFSHILKLKYSLADREEAVASWTVEKAKAVDADGEEAVASWMVEKAKAVDADGEEAVASCMDEKDPLGKAVETIVTEVLEEAVAMSVDNSSSKVEACKLPADEPEEETLTSSDDEDNKPLRRRKRQRCNSDVD